MFLSLLLLLLVLFDCLKFPAIYSKSFFVPYSMTGLYIVRYTIKCNAVYQYFDDDFNNVASDVSCVEVALCIATYILLNVDILTQCSIGHYWYPNSCVKNDRFQNLTSHYVYDQKLRSKSLM